MAQDLADHPRIHDIGDPAQSATALRADTALWPEQERVQPAELARLLARDPELVRAFDDARELDSLLHELDAPAVDDLHAQRLQQRILATLPAQQSRLPQSRARALWRPALAALVPLVIGFGGGMLGAGAIAEQTPTHDETEYADVATMSPFLLASNFDALTRAIP